MMCSADQVVSDKGIDELVDWPLLVGWEQVGSEVKDMQCKRPPTRYRRDLRNRLARVIIQNTDQ